MLNAWTDRVATYKPLRSVLLRSVVLRMEFVCLGVGLAKVRPARLAVAQAGSDLLARVQAQLLEDTCHLMVHRALADNEL